MEYRNYQKEVQRLCGFYNTDPDNKLIFNLPYDEISKDQVLLNNYSNFLKVCYEKIKEFSDSRDIKICSSYKIDGLSDEEINKFDELEELYSSKYNIEIKKTIMTEHNYTRMTEHNYPTDEEIYQFNESVIDNTMKDKKYNEQTDQHIWDILQNNRLADLKECFEKSKSSEKKIKTAKEIEFYENEYSREKDIIDDIISKVDTGELIIPDKKYHDLSDEEKKQTALGFISDKIQWGIKGYYEYDDDIISKILEKIGDNQSLIKNLMLFLPLELFNIIPLSNNDEYLYEIKEKEFRDFIKEQSDLKNNFQQYRLGLGEDLFGGEIRNWMSNIQQLWSTYSLIVDLNNHCGKFIDYNIYLNLFCLYMFGRSNTKMFPMSFILSSNPLHDIYNQTSQSYSFRTRAPRSIKELFNSSFKFIGIHLIKYKKNGKLKIHPLFTFFDPQFKTKIDMIRSENEQDNFQGISSLYTCQRVERFVIDTRMFFVEDGEIAPAMNITHHELYNALYYKLRPYVIHKEDRKQLYFTMKSRDEVKEFMENSKIKLEEVFIIKKKIEGKTQQRLVIRTLDEARNEIDNKTGFLICRQTLPAKTVQNGGTKNKNKTRTRKLNRKLNKSNSRTRKLNKYKNKTKKLNRSRK
jgi:hypothetical protein